MDREVRRSILIDEFTYRRLKKVKRLYGYSILDVICLGLENIEGGDKKWK